MRRGFRPMFSGNTARLPLSSSPSTASFSLRGSGVDWSEGATVEHRGLPLYQGSLLTIPRFGSTSETNRTGAPGLPSWRRRTGSGGAFSTLCAGGATTSQRPPRYSQKRCMRYHRRFAQIAGGNRSAILTTIHSCTGSRDSWAARRGFNTSSRLRRWIPSRRVSKGTG